jgi:anthranilate synthase component II
VEKVMASARLLVIDNYDSFTFNLVQMFMQYELMIRVCRSDEITLEDVPEWNPDYILISPGPKDPEHAGISKKLIRTFCDKVPILGVCLGMQCINEVFGGSTVRSPRPIHGKTSKIHHSKRGIFEGLSSPFIAARYHSLQVKTMKGKLVETAHCEGDIVMGLSHPEFPLHGVQFHPESFMTENGFMLIENFLRLGPAKISGYHEHTRNQSPCRTG